jgi:hypothetical protein
VNREPRQTRERGLTPPNFPRKLHANGHAFMNHQTAYKDFTAHFKLLISKNPHLITTTLSNIFTMRLIGNKTHGDLAEIAIAEFINQFMYNFKSVHTGNRRHFYSLIYGILIE